VAEIRARAAEIAFNATFRCEAAQLGAACDAASADGWIAAQLAGPRQRRLRRLRWHLIDAQDALGPLASETKLLAHRPFLEKLHGMGMHRARVWLQGDAARVGKSSTVHLPSWFA
jgi:NTE family protein